MELLEWQDPPETEHLDGRAYAKVSPKRTHSFVQRNLMAVLERTARSFGEYGAEWRFNLGRVDNTLTDFVPDIAVVSYERLAPLTGDDAEEPPFAPDVAIEIRSPGSNERLIAAKIARYLRCGAVLVLDVMPQERLIAAHSTDGPRVYRAGDRFEHPAAPWLVFDVARIFPK
jgi:Uma2 family endonuclease